MFLMMVGAFHLNFQRKWAGGRGASPPVGPDHESLAWKPESKGAIGAAARYLPEQYDQFWRVQIKKFWASVEHEHQ